MSPEFVHGIKDVNRHRYGLFVEWVAYCDYGCKHLCQFH